MENKPKLVVVLSRFPYPLEKGDKLRAFNFIKGLSVFHDIYLICTSDEEITQKNKHELAHYCKEIHVFKLTKWGLLFELLSDPFTKRPFQVHYFYRKKIHKKIQSLLTQIEPDHIFCQLVRVSEYVKHYRSCSKTLDYMDVLSVGMQRRTKTEKWIKRWFFKLEFERLRNYERKIFDYFENKIIISEQDKTLISHPNFNQIKVISNGISEKFFTAKAIEKDHDLVFVGNLSYAPNIEAAEILALKIIPELHKRGHKLNLLLSGASPDERIVKLKNEFITVTGWVEDIRESYLRGRLFVAPLFIGTGQQNKVIEAIALQLPCVTSSLVSRGLNQYSLQNIILADDINTFVEKIIFAFQNFEYLLSKTENDSVNIKENYQWKKCVSELNNLIKLQ